MPSLTTEELTLALAIVAGVALIGLLITLILALKLRRARREYAVLRGDKDEQDVVAAAGRAVKRAEEIGQRLDALWADQQGHGLLSRRAVQRFGVVRYDAFEEMGGRLSFSLALLDDHGDGVMFTSINGRTEARTYAKQITAYDSEHNLSQEEKEAIAAAVANYGRTETPIAVSQAR